MGMGSILLSGKNQSSPTLQSYLVVALCLWGKFVGDDGLRIVQGKPMLFIFYFAIGR